MYIENNILYTETKIIETGQILEDHFDLSGNKSV